MLVMGGGGSAVVGLKGSINRLVQGVGSERPAARYDDGVMEVRNSDRFGGGGGILELQKIAEIHSKPHPVTLRLRQFTALGQMTTRLQQTECVQGRRLIKMSDKCRGGNFTNGGGRSWKTLVPSE
ncbi:hypothetical protein EYF80_020976 [Liparis tanakae]|uniref:Uncharacterized protein n=1 Tax=Liparis tanakae TaxID=230148 RepID=A0A4Z2HSQ1_9TELE|nr:hypothetical protein EYF80_020976 [Liparis tanakae]